MFPVEIVLFVCLAAAASVGHAADWAHKGDHGVEHWPELFAECAGSSQSPIDIFTNKNDDTFVYDENLTNDLDIVRGTDDAKYYLVNNGHTVYIDTSDAEVTVFGANLGKTYTVVGPHFHWGATNNRGSEHTFNSIEYPLEMHIVTYDAESYDTVSAAVTSNVPGALAVVGVMFQLSEEDNPLLAPIIENIPSVQHPDKENKVPMEMFPLKDLLPAETSEYFRYSGSLTTPTCNEVVTWTVLLHPQTVSQAQLDALRSVHEKHEPEMTNLVDNYRPVQPLNGRKVYKSFMEPSIEWPEKDSPVDKEDDGPGSAATKPLIGHVIGVVAVLISLFFAH